MASASPSFTLRIAEMRDVAALRELIERSVLELQRGDYSEEQMEGALGTVFGVDTRLIEDGTYFVVEVECGGRAVIVGCGGWSKRKTLFGGDAIAGRQDMLLDPTKDAAKIRAFFVHPEWARKGIASRILERCEEAARDEGFRQLEMGATLTGVPMYAARGYKEIERIEVPLKNGVSLPVVRMGKRTPG